MIIEVQIVFSANVFGHRGLDAAINFAARPRLIESIGVLDREGDLQRLANKVRQ
jgi:hypothetical protein